MDNRSLRITLLFGKNHLSGWKCRACGEENGEIKRLEGGHWLVVCSNGECPQLPEVNARWKSFALKLWGEKV